MDDPGLAAEHGRAGLAPAGERARASLGHHGPEIEASGVAARRATASPSLVASDGHRAARPPHLDEAYRAVQARLGEGADALFDGRGSRSTAASGVATGVDLAERR